MCSARAVAAGAASAGSTATFAMGLGHSSKHRSRKQSDGYLFQHLSLPTLLRAALAFRLSGGGTCTLTLHVQTASLDVPTGSKRESSVPLPATIWLKIVAMRMHERMLSTTSKRVT